MLQLVLECHDGKARASCFGRDAEFTLLTADARARVGELLGKEFVYLQIYLEESDRNPGSTGPGLQELNANPELGSVAWLPFVRWLAGRSASYLLFLHDTVWDDGWKNIKEVLAKRGVHEIDLRPTSRPGFFAIRSSSRAVGRIVQSWWPSRAGDFAGVSLTGQGGDELVDIIAATGVIGAADVEMATLVFETSRHYENLGIDVLVRVSECRAVLEELSLHGMNERTAER